MHTMLAIMMMMAHARMASEVGGDGTTTGVRRAIVNGPGRCEASRLGVEKGRGWSVEAGRGHILRDSGALGVRALSGEGRVRRVRIGRGDEARGRGCVVVIGRVDRWDVRIHFLIAQGRFSPRARVMRPISFLRVLVNVP